MYFNQRFNALAKEALFTKDLLGSGATIIRKADYAQKGIYFQAFTLLSTGFERIGKLCFMLDYYIDNNGTFPSIKYLKNDIGHKLIVIYNKTCEVIKKRSLSFEFLNNLDDEIHQNILNVLSEFAEGDRYSNLNLLTDENYLGDPVASWFRNVDQLLFDKCVPEKKKIKIAGNAKVISEMVQHFTMVRHISETGSEINNVEEASYRTGMKEAVAPFRQLYILQMIRFWVEVLNNIQVLARSIELEDIPEFGEIFAMFYNSDSYFKTRKSWDGLY